jgi:hypothetical protein
MNDHHFNELMTWLLGHGREDADARAVALTLTRQLIAKIQTESLSDERRIRPLLPLLLKKFPEIVWPLIGNAITSDPKVAWRFQYSLGKGFSFASNREQPPISSYPRTRCCMVSRPSQNRACFLGVGSADTHDQRSRSRRARLPSHRATAYG